MKILIVSSPTGGHFYPAIEVSKKLFSEAEKIIFVIQGGTKFKNIIEKELASSEKIIIEEVFAGKFLRKNPLSLIKVLFLFIFSFLKTFLIYLKHKPEIIFSTGGYTSFPVVFTMKFVNPYIPVILHEQNYILSITNKILKFFATKVCLGLDVGKNPKKFIFTGNPLREKFYKVLDRESIYKELRFKKENFTLFVFGGSQGAKSLNEAIVGILEKNIEKFQDCQMIHITGFNSFKDMKEKYLKININAFVIPYSEEIEKFYTIADLVICRAGAMTISELIHFRKPAILIPLPTAAELHQNFNAEFLRRYGCAEVVYQSKGWEEKLLSKILYIFENKDVLTKMQKNFNKIPKPSVSIEKVIKNIYEIQSL